MTRPTDNSRTAHLDFLLPRKPCLRPDEIAKALHCNGKSVAAYFESGELLGLELNKVNGERMTRRFPRPWALLCIAHMSNCQAEDITDRLAEVLHSLSREQLAHVYATAARLLANK